MYKLRTRDVVVLFAIIVFAVVTAALAPRYVAFVAAVERWLADVRTSTLSEPLPDQDDIVIAAITEETLAKFSYRSPIDRAFLAEIVKKFDRAGARAIGVDVLFDQPTEPEKDAVLYETLHAVRAPIVVAWAQEEDRLTPEQAAFLNDFSQDLMRGWATLMVDERSGIARWIYPGREADGTFIPGFAGAIASALGHAPDHKPAPTVYGPADADSRPFRVFPAHTIPLLPDSWFADKIVLIGSAIPHQDRHRTPWVTALGEDSGSLPGVFIHGYALAQILGNYSLPTTPLGVELGLLALASIIAIMIAALNVSALWQVILGLTTLVLYWIGGFAVYDWLSLMLPLASPSIAFLLTAAMSNAYLKAQSSKQREYIKQAFSRYTAPAVVETLIADPNKLSIRGEKRQISCLFTDLAGFTGWIERTDPETAIRHFNQYLDGMSKIVFEYGGTIDKIVGDALHVIFNAPLDQKDHAERAVACAITLHEFAAAFAEQKRSEGFEFGETRIGVHTGTVLVGNFGGDRFFDYTAHGDTMNTAARLEGANKYLGTLICVSATAALRCPDVIFRPIGRLVLEGKHDAIEVLEPVVANSQKAETLTIYLEAFASMRDHKGEAVVKFAELLERDSTDGLARFHLQRLSAGDSDSLIVMRGK